VITLSKIYVHPVKSLRGLQLSHAQASSSGLAFDRTFMITEPDGTFITARQYPQMVMFTPALLPDGLFLTAPDGESAASASAISPLRRNRPKFGAIISPP
jgi:uncharacterized protein